MPASRYLTFTIQPQKLYIYKEEHNQFYLFLNIMGTTIGLRLANKLVVEEFRDAAFKHLPRLTN